MKLANVSTGAHVDVFPCGLLAVSSASRCIVGCGELSEGQVSGDISREVKREGEDCHPKEKELNREKGKCGINTPKRIGVYEKLLRRLSIGGNTREAQPAMEPGSGPGSGGRARSDGDARTRKRIDASTPWSSTG